MDTTRPLDDIPADLPVNGWRAPGHDTSPPKANNDFPYKSIRS
jgi:hypothetical protein